MEEETKNCSRCGANHTLLFYGIKESSYIPKKVGNDLIPKIYRDSVCNECRRIEREARQKKDPDYIYKAKAYKALQGHAKREGMGIKRFCDTYDLTVDYIAYMIKKEWIAYSQLGMPCPSCRVRHTDEDPLTLDKLTIDRLYPDKGFSQSNIRVVCKTYNTGKGRKDPIIYDEYCKNYRNHEKQLAKGVQFSLQGETRNATKPLQSTFF